MLWCGSEETQSVMHSLRKKNMGLNLNEIKQARHHYITMGRGRKGVIDQGNNKKDKRNCGPLPKEDRNVFHAGLKTPANQTIIDLPEEVLNAFRQMNPRDVANILVNN